jgi:hypothetical protein
MTCVTIFVIPQFGRKFKTHNPLGDKSKWESDNPRR